MDTVETPEQLEAIRDCFAKLDREMRTLLDACCYRDDGDAPGAKLIAARRAIFHLIEGVNAKLEGRFDVADDMYFKYYDTLRGYARDRVKLLDMLGDISVLDVKERKARVWRDLHEVGDNAGKAR